MKLFERLEEAFEETSLLGLADRVRNFLMCFLPDDDPQLEWREKCYAEEKRGLSIIQREIYLKEEVKARAEKSESKKLTTEEATELEAWEKELKGMDQKYWLHKRAINKINLEKPKGPWSRDWDSKRRRSTLQGRVHRAPVELEITTRARWPSNSRRRRPAIVGPRQCSLCAGRGGCCGRGCGCCERYLKTHRDLVYGHCTIECGCCIRNRGFRRLDPDALARAGLNRRDLPWDSNI